MLAASDAREIDRANPPDTLNQLMNVVEEMRLASGQPMPRVFVIPDTAPNAFATGRDPKHASLAVTSGLLEKMDREELQGVVAHEMSHIRNFDIRFMLLIGVMVGTIALLADWFLRISFWSGVGGRRRGSSEGGGGAMAIVAIVALLLSVISPIIGRLVMLAASRRREGLADVSAVELTRNPLGLAAALRKIADDPRGARGRQQGHPAPVHRQSDQSVRKALELDVGHAPAARRADRGPRGPGRSRLRVADAAQRPPEPTVSARRPTRAEVARW